MRQGDPLSPYLFILAMEGLIVAIKEAVSKGLLKGVSLPNGGPIISSLHFADDALFFGNWSDDNVKNLMLILECFHMASGLKINWGKSIINGIGISDLELHRLASSIGCKEGKFPLHYLGLPIGGSPKKERILADVIREIQ